jgi:hypothetical protein
LAIILTPALLELLTGRAGRALPTNALRPEVEAIVLLLRAAEDRAELVIIAAEAIFADLSLVANYLRRRMG